MSMTASLSFLFATGVQAQPRLSVTAVHVSLKIQACRLCDIMVYYLNDIEHKQLLKKLRPLSRGVGVTEELRGWSWDNSPLKTNQEVKLPMYSICSKYCPTSRDAYLRHVLKKKGGEK